MLSINMTTMCDFNDYIIYQNKYKNDAGISIGFSLIMYLIGCLGIFTIFGIIHFFYVIHTR